MAKMMKKTKTAIIAVATVATMVASMQPASADRQYMGGGAGVFEDVVRDYGRKVGQGARNYYDKYKDRARDSVINRGFREVNKNAFKLRTPALPFVVVPEGYSPGQWNPKDWK